MAIIEGNLEFRSQTSDNMGRGGKSQRRAEKKQEDQRRESRKSLCFSNDLWLRRVEKYAR